jgi:HEAT repeat protein
MNMEHGLSFRIAALLLLMTSLVVMAMQAAGQSRKTSNTLEIERMIKEIRTESRNKIREDVAKYLAAFVAQKKLEVENDDGTTIDEIASLLGDRDDLVRYWAAMALQHIGPAARQAVPALQKALREIEPEVGSGKLGPSASSASAIRKALHSITGEDMTPDPLRKRPGSWESRGR